MAHEGACARSQYGQHARSGWRRSHPRPPHLTHGMGQHTSPSLLIRPDAHVAPGATTLGDGVGVGGTASPITHGAGPASQDIPELRMRVMQHDAPIPPAPHDDPPQVAHDAAQQTLPRLMPDAHVGSAAGCAPVLVGCALRQRVTSSKIASVDDDGGNVAGAILADKWRQGKREEARKKQSIMMEVVDDGVGAVLWLFGIGSDSLVRLLYPDGRRASQFSSNFRRKTQVIRRVVRLSACICAIQSGF